MLPNASAVGFKWIATRCENRVAFTSFWSDRQEQVAVGTLNLYACWDWWGYTGADYRWRNGAQMKVLADWIRGM